MSPCRRAVYPKTPRCKHYLRVLPASLPQYGSTRRISIPAAARFAGAKRYQSTSIRNRRRGERVSAITVAVLRIVSIHRLDPQYGAGARRGRARIPVSPSPVFCIISRRCGRASLGGERRIALVAADRRRRTAARPERRLRREGRRRAESARPFLRDDLGNATILLAFLRIPPSFQAICPSEASRSDWDLVSASNRAADISGCEVIAATKCSGDRSAPAGVA